MIVPTIYAVTGGAGSGKSTFTQKVADHYFAKSGKILQTVDMDVEMKNLLTQVNGSTEQCHLDVMTAFGFETVHPIAWDYSKVKEKLITDPSLFPLLTQTLRPHARDIMLRKGVDRILDGTGFALIEASALFEYDLADMVDEVIVIDVPENIRIKRLQNKGWSTETINAILSNQLTDGDRFIAATDTKQMPPDKIIVSNVNQSELDLSASMYAEILLRRHPPKNEKDLQW